MTIFEKASSFTKAISKKKRFIDFCINQRFCSPLQTSPPTNVLCLLVVQDLKANALLDHIHLQTLSETIHEFIRT